MAGVKGKSGGPRPNSGRKPKPQPKPIKVEAAEKPDELAEDCDMLKLLQDVALGRIESTPLQVRAAIAAVQYTHIKRGDGGIREETAKKAKQASAGKFGASAVPLALVK